MRARNLFWLAAVSLSLIAVSLQQASADPVTDVTFGASETNNGTIGLGFYFLNSNGANPLTSSSSWSSLSRLNLAFSATTGSDTFSNLGFAATSVSSFGAPDTTTYGEVFQLPSEDALESWTFLIKNNPGPGTQATFGLATWDSTNSRASTLLYSAAVTAPVKINGNEGVTAFPGGAVDLDPNQQYVAFLTVADLTAPVPGPTVGAGASSFALAALFLGWLVRRRGHQMV